MAGYIPGMAKQKGPGKTGAFISGHADDKNQRE
jgi:hypothetical protein